MPFPAMSNNLQDSVQCFEKMTSLFLTPLNATGISLFEVKTPDLNERYYTTFILKLGRQNTKFTLSLDRSTLESLQRHFPEWAGFPKEALIEWLQLHSKKSLPKGIKKKLTGLNIC